MYLNATPDRASGPREAPSIDVLDVAARLEMQGMVDETTQHRFGRDVFAIARQRVESGQYGERETAPWSTTGPSGRNPTVERWVGVVARFLQGALFGCGTLFVFLMLWFSDLSLNMSPAGGVLVATAVYLGCAGWSRLMSISAGGVVYYSPIEADRQLARYVLRAAVTLALVMGLISLGYAVSGAFSANLGPMGVVLATIANLTLFWLTLAYAAAQRRPWAVLVFTGVGVAGFFVAGALVDPARGMQMQLALAAFNGASLLYMAGCSLLAFRSRNSYLEYSRAAVLPRRRRRFLGALGIGYGFLILSDFVLLTAVGYFDAIGEGTKVYLALKLVAIIPLVVSLGVMEVLEYRLGEAINRHEQRVAPDDPAFAAGIKRAFLSAMLVFAGLHVLLGAVAGALLLPGMPLRHLIGDVAITADVVGPGLLAALGIMFALAGMFCATMLSTLGEDAVILKWLLYGLAISLVLGGALYPVAGILGAALGFAAGTGAFLWLGAHTVVTQMKAYPLLSYRQALG